MSEVLFPKVKVKLVGTDGNAFSLMGKVSAALRRAKVSEEEINKFHEEAMSGNYDHLLRTCCKYVKVS